MVYENVLCARLYTSIFHFSQVFAGIWMRRGLISVLCDFIMQYANVVRYLMQRKLIDRRIGDLIV